MTKVIIDYESRILVLFVSNFCLSLEFIVFALNQEECHKIWLQTEKNLLEVIAQIEKAQQTTTQLVLQNQQVHVKRRNRSMNLNSKRKKHLVPEITRIPVSLAE